MSSASTTPADAMMILRTRPTMAPLFTLWKELPRESAVGKGIMVAIEIEVCDGNDDVDKAEAIAKGQSEDGTNYSNATDC